MLALYQQMCCKLTWWESSAVFLQQRTVFRLGVSPESIQSCAKDIRLNQSQALSSAHHTLLSKRLRKLTSHVAAYYSTLRSKESNSSCIRSIPAASCRRRSQISQELGKQRKIGNASAANVNTESSLEAHNPFNVALGKSALSFAFNFLKRCWRSNHVEDHHMCGSLLHDCLEAFESIPVASLFGRHKVQEPVNGPLIEIAHRSIQFLESCLQGLASSFILFYAP